MQYAKFPMKVVNITQTPNGGYSHKGRLTVDNAGKDAGIDDVFAPFDCRVVWKDKGSAKTGVLIENVMPVECADGVTRKARSVLTVLWHDNDTTDLTVGQIFKQGEVFYQEGTAGNATGNHLHFGVGIGPFDGSYPLVKNDFGNWEIKNEIHPTNIFFIDDSHIVKNTMGMKWVKHEEPTKVVEDLAKVPDAALKIGDKVKITGKAYANGIAVSKFAKEKTHIVGKIDAGKVRLVGEVVNGAITKTGINSWLYTKDVSKA